MENFKPEPIGYENDVQSESSKPKPPMYLSYIGTKIVQATPISYEAWAASQNKWTQGQETLGDGYMVIYEDGYRSWSPKDVFERSYRLITNSEKNLIV